MTKANNRLNCSQSLLFDQSNAWSRRLSAGARNWKRISCSADGEKIAASEDSGYIYVSLDKGNTWRKSNSPSKIWANVQYSKDSKYIIACSDSLTSSDGIVYVSTDYGNSFSAVKQANSGQLTGCCCSGDGKYMAACDYFNGNGSTSDNIYLSSDYGQNWTTSSAGIKPWGRVCCSYDGSIFLVTVGGESNVYVSTNYGANWSAKSISSGGFLYDACCMSDSGTTMYIGQSQYAKKISKSSDTGSNWTELANSPSILCSQISCSSDGLKVLAVDATGYVWLSINGGATWTSQDIFQLTNQWQGAAISSNGSIKYVSRTASDYVYSFGNYPNFPVCKNLTNTMVTTSQNLTTTSETISGMEITLTQIGTYEIKANINEDLTSITANNSANYSTYQLYTATDSISGFISGTEKIGTQVPASSTAFTGISSSNKSFSWLYVSNTENNTIKIYGKINSSVTGNWKIKNDSSGRSSIFARFVS